MNAIMHYYYRDRGREHDPILPTGRCLNAYKTRSSLTNRAQLLPDPSQAKSSGPLYLGRGGGGLGLIFKAKICLIIQEN